MMNASPGVPGINFRSSLRPYRRRRGSLILVCYVLGRGRFITTKTDFKFYCFFSCFYLVFMLWDFFILVLKLFSCFISRIVLFNICIRVYVLKLGLIEICINFITVRFFKKKYSHRFFKKHEDIFCSTFYEITMQLQVTRSWL